MFCTSSPNVAAPRMASARFAAASSAFEGTDPVLRLSPPIASRSISTVGTPKAAAAPPAHHPPRRAPITQFSGAGVSPMPPTGPARASCSGTRARPPIFHHDRHQREQAERDERRDQLRRQNVRRVERQPTIGAPCRDTLIIRILLR